MASNMIQAFSWDELFHAYEVQSAETAQSCASLTNQMLKNDSERLKAQHDANAPLGFTDKQFLSAIKTLDIALQLFTDDLTEEQLECTRMAIECARISAKLMWEDRLKAGTRLSPVVFKQANKEANEALREIRRASVANKKT